MVHRMVAENQKNRAVSILDQGFEEIDERIRIECPVNGFEAQLTARRD